VVVAVAGWFYLRNLRLYGDLTGSAALLERFGRVPRGSVAGLLTDPGFWRAQQQRLWGAGNLVPGATDGLARWLWLLGLVPLAGLLVAGGGWLAGRLRGVGGRLDQGRAVAVGLCLLLLGLLQLSVVQFATGGGTAHARYLLPGLVTVGLLAAVGLAALPGGRRGLPAVAMLLTMTWINLWVWQHHPSTTQVAGWPWPLVAVVPLVLVGIGLQAVALWHLER
jgi:hypothetical protein